MVDGKIAEKGTYQELLSAGGALAKLVAEHVSEKNPGQLEEKEEVGVIETKEDLELKEVELHEKLDEAAEDAKKNDPGALLTMKEERETGAVSLRVYKRYMQSMGSMWIAPLFLGCLMLAQAANVGTSIFLGKWSDSAIEGWSQGQCAYYLFGFHRGFPDCYRTFL